MAFGQLSRQYAMSAQFPGRI
ncbi:hypothetical protein BCEP4_410040 [Burkholderia cepacia]|nr:hypothetical protein BCEP4_410040 [Burkholderia cepacia]